MSESLIKIILENLKKVEGPVSAYILKPTNYLKGILKDTPPIFLLFGDVHKGSQKCKEGCDEKEGCYSFYFKGESKILRGNKVPSKVESKVPPSIHNLFNDLSQIANVDVFLEFWFPFQIRQETFKIKQVSEDTSGLYDFAIFSAPCLQLRTKEGCQIDNYKIHMTDTRKDRMYKNIDSITVEAMLKLNYNSFLNYVEEYFVDEDPRRIIKLVSDRLRLGTTEFLKTEFRQNPIVKKWSKTYKQLAKLPQKLQNMIYETYSELTDELNKSLRKASKVCENPEKNLVNLSKAKFTYREDLIQVNKDYYYVEDLYYQIQAVLRMYYDPRQDVSDCQLSGFYTGLDLYFLGRSLDMSIKKDIVVGYFGEFHVTQLVNFLIGTNLYEIVTMNVGDGDIMDYRKFNKCLQIS